MAIATYTKNGMIHIPKEIQRIFDLNPGDKISFTDTGDGIVIVPIKGLFSLVNPEEKSIANEVALELKNEHLNEIKGGEDD